MKVFPRNPPFFDANLKISTVCRFALKAVLLPLFKIPTNMERRVRKGKLGKEVCICKSANSMACQPILQRDSCSSPLSNCFGRQAVCWLQCTVGSHTSLRSDFPIYGDFISAMLTMHFSHLTLKVSQSFF